MDVAKVRSALTALKAEVKNVVDVEYKAGRIKSLGSLARVDQAIAGVEKRLDKAVEASAPKEKKAKKGKAAA